MVVPNGLGQVSWFGSVGQAEARPKKSNCLTCYLSSAEWPNSLIIILIAADIHKCTRINSLKCPIDWLICAQTLERVELDCNLPILVSEPEQLTLTIALLSRNT